jgi:signal transduction histidine kinase
VQVTTAFLDTPPSLFMDKKLMKRALCNMIKNALEAMEATDEKRLAIRTIQSGDYLLISIADTGKGIEKDKIKTIFDPMVSSKMFSPGLGLTFALKIVQYHNGTITVESEPGKGTTFTISFPVGKT